MNKFRKPGFITYKGEIRINNENKSLADQVNSLKTDPKAIERIAREEMGLARPGELIYKLPDPTKPGGPQKPDSQ